MRTIFILASLIWWPGCADEAFQESSESTRGSRLSTSSTESSESNVSGPEIAQETTSPAEVEDNDTRTANEPVMAGGAFLVCQQFEATHCRLDNAEMTNLEMDPAFEVQFFADSLPVDQSPSELDSWRWQLTMEADGASQIELRLSWDGQVITSLPLGISSGPLHIGDGTQALQGCTTEFMSQAENVGNVLSRPLTVKESAPYVVTLSNLCGVGRANDSSFTILNTDGGTIFQEFLPATTEPVDLTINIPTLPSGDYTLRVAAGDDIDIDDIFLGGLSISAVSK
jgi:hypothetical protein